MSSPRRYPSDLTDEQWALLELLLPEPDPRAGGRPRSHPRREIVNAILYVVRSGGAWRQLPADFPPWQTVYWYFASWADDGTLDRLHDILGLRVRRAEGRLDAPTAGIVDAQSVRGADTVPAVSRGYDAGKRVNGRKRHIIVDTFGLLLVVLVTAASVQDRDGGRRAMLICRQAHPTIRLVWADGGYAGKLVAWARTVLDVILSVVTKPAGRRGFAVLPRRWVVERTFAWITGCRRLACDYERTISHSEAMTKWAMVGLMTRRLAPTPGRRSWS